MSCAMLREGRPLAIRGRSLARTTRRRRHTHADEAAGTPGRAVLAAGAQDWVFERQSEESFTPTAPFPLSHLIDCLEHKRPLVATIHDARKSFVAAMAAYESARLGTAVEVG